MALAHTQDRKGLILTIGAAAAVAVMAVAGVVQDNPGEISLIDGARALAVLLAIAIAAPAAGFALGGAFRVIAYAFPLMLFCFFKFAGFIGLAEVLGFRTDGAVIAGVVIMALICAVATEPFRRRNPVTLATFIFVVTAAAAAGPLVLAGLSAAKTARHVAPTVAEMSSPLDVEAAANPSALPDIIYIVPDRYGRKDALLSAYGIDNQPFLDALEARGFYVAEKARANYPRTYQSLASTLNLTPLDDLFEALGSKAIDRRPVYELMQNNVVEKTLREQGYSFVYLGGWPEPTRRNQNADQNFYGLRNAWSSLSEFERALLRTTPVAYAATYGGFYDRDECSRLKTQLDFLKTVRRDAEGPLFVFAHLLMPHPPITMDGDGGCIPHIIYQGGGDKAWQSYRNAFRDYMSVLNSELLEIFDANSVVDNGRDLIFAIQADEGPYPRRLHADNAMDMFSFDRQELDLKFGILNALYWDAEKYGAPYLTETPVNNWRIILSEVTGTDLPLISDERSAIYRDENNVYDLRDVTDVLTHTDQNIARLKE